MTDKKKLIAKLYKGNCSREELETLLNLLTEAPDEDYSDVMAKLWQELKSYPEIEEPMASEMMRQLLARVERQESVSVETTNSKIRRNQTSIRIRRRSLIRYSGAAAALLLVGFFFWFWSGTEKPIVVQTTFAEQKTFELPDHSTVKLNANSSLRFHKTWKKGKTRQVWLNGEAYFEVQKDQRTGRKFQVITNDLTVEVLGTVFNVNAREASTEVFLAEGKVGLDFKEKTEGILMEPGELVTYSRSSGLPLKKQIEKEAPTSWKDGTAIMEDALLKDIIQKIHEIYDVQVVVENAEYLERQFTVFLPVDNPEMGYSMLVAMGLEIEKAGKQWLIK